MAVVVFITEYELVGAWIELGWNRGLEVQVGECLGSTDEQKIEDQAAAFVSDICTAAAASPDK